MYPRVKEIFITHYPLPITHYPLPSHKTYESPQPNDRFPILE